jgi:uncharacterized membrane protein YqhA
MPRLGSMVASARWVALLGVVCSVAGAVLAFVLAFYQMAHVSGLLLTSETSHAGLQLVQVMDRLLIGSALLLFAFGLYDLFIGPLHNMPSQLEVHGLDDLKSKLASVVVLVLGITFLERLLSGEAGTALLEEALSISLVAGVLVAFSRLARKA